MLRKHKIVSAGGIIILSFTILNIIIIRAGLANNENWYWALAVSVPLLLLAIFNIRQKKHALLRNFPLIGYVRYFLESIQPEIRQYFFESDLKKVQNLHSQLN